MQAKALEQVVVESKGGTAGMLVILHGYGADMHDLSPLAGEFQMPALRWVFPNAPLSPPMLAGGRAWAPIDMQAIQEAMMRGTHRDLSGPAPGEFYDSLKLLHECIERECKRADIPLSKVVVGGFSQGSMMATALALTLPQPPAGLVIWSGNLVDVAQLSAWVKARPGLNFYQSHGTQDPILGVSGAKKLFHLLSEAGLTGTFTEFRGGHEIPGQVLRETREFLQRVLPL